MISEQSPEDRKFNNRMPVYDASLIPTPARVTSFVPDLFAPPHQDTHSEREEEHSQGSEETKWRGGSEVGNHRLQKERTCIGEQVADEVEDQVRLGALARVTF
jgi:hypothetical protein